MGGHKLGRGTRSVGAVAILFVIGCASGTLDDSEITFGSGSGPSGGGTVGETDGESATSGGPGSGPSSSASASGSAGETDDAGDCIDLDGDGYGDGCPAGPDCDDDDPEVHPGADEKCNGQDDNCDGEVDNGCDCPEDGVSGNCNMPTDLGPLSPGDMVLSVVGTVPQESALDWYTVSFPAGSRPGEGMPAIEFAINEDDAFVFDVVSGQCQATGIGCGEGGTNGAGIGLDAWSFVDDEPGCCTPPNHAMMPWPEQIYLRVYRTTAGASCGTYQLRVSR
jgi:hypothetical protein